MGLVLPLSSGEKRVAELSDEQGERCMAVLQVAEPGVVVHGAPGGAGKSGGLHIGGLLSVHSQPLRSLECLNGGSSAYLSALQHRQAGEIWRRPYARSAAGPRGLVHPG
jgi:hypothetical protein